MPAVAVLLENVGMGRRATGRAALKPSPADNALPCGRLIGAPYLESHARRVTDSCVVPSKEQGG